MEEFSQSLGFVVWFLVGALATNMLFGTKFLYVFLLLVLAGMVFTNTDKVIKAFSMPEIGRPSQGFTSGGGGGAGGGGAGGF